MNGAELTLDSVQDALNEIDRHPEFFLRRRPDAGELDLDAEARAALRDTIIVRRPQIFLSRRPAAMRPHEAAELRRTHVLYLVRLAPLTEGSELTTAGNFFSTLQRADTDFAVYRNRYAAKFGYTTRACGERLNEVVSEIKRKGFPATSMNPFFALSIDGLLQDQLFLHRMESGLRNLLDRAGLRLRQHAQGVQHPANRTQFAETFEFVHTDFYCNAPFDLFQLYAQSLDAERTRVNAIVNLFDIRRRQDVQRDRDNILVHYDEDRADRSVYDTLMEEVEANNRRLDVRTLYCTAHCIAPHWRMRPRPAMFVAMLNAMVVRSVALMSSEQPP